MESIEQLTALPPAAAKQLIELTGNFLCADTPLEKLKSEVTEGIAKIGTLEGVTKSTEDLQKIFEQLAGFIEAKYSKPYEASQLELEKIGIVFGNLKSETLGIKGEVWNWIKLQIKGYRKNLLNVYDKGTSGVSANGKLVDFNYEFISTFFVVAESPRIKKI